MKQNFNKIREKMQKMCQSINIFCVDISFLIVLFFIFFLGEVRFYIFYILSLIGHELSHFFVAKKLGYYPKKIKLNFFGAALEGDDDFLIKDEIKVVFAGPIFNFLLIIFCYLCFWFEPETYIYLYDLLIANWALLLFNILPIFPLDCGRFLLLIFSIKKDRISAVNITKKISFCFVLFVFFLGIFMLFNSLNITLAISAINLMVLTLSDSSDTSYKRQLFVDRKFRLLRKGLLCRTIYFSNDIPKFALFKFIDDSHYFKFVFLNSDYQVTEDIDEIEFYKQMGML